MNEEHLTAEPSVANMPPELDPQVVAQAAEAEAKKIADARAILTPGADDRYSHYIEHPTAEQREAATFLAGKREEIASHAEAQGNQKEAELQRTVAKSYRGIAARK